MKPLCIFILICFSTSVAQSPGWTGLKETNVTVGNNNYDIFTNLYGNHIIVQEPSALKYYKVDVSGNDVAPTPITLESSAVVSPSITGNADIIYVVYGISNEIRTKYSTDGGSNWSNLSNPIYAPVISVESIVSKDNLHITYQEGTSVKYSRRSVSGGSWTEPFTVSGTYDAETPRIGVWNAGTADKVYFIYKSYNYIRWREYDPNDPVSPWSPVDWYVLYGYNYTPFNLGFAVDDTYLYSFTRPSTPPQILEWWIRRISDNFPPIGSGNSNGNTSVQKIFSTTTANNKPYTAAWDQTNDPQPPYRISRLGFNGTYNLEEDLIYQDPNLSPVNIVNLSAAGNDVYVIWKDNLSYNKLRYKYYDDFPLAPQGLAVEPYQQGNEVYARVTWQLNNEPDVFIRQNDAFEVERRVQFLNNPWGPWEVVASKSGNETEFIDTEVHGNGAERYTAEYRMRARDVGNHLSVYSGSVFYTFEKFTGKIISAGVKRFDYMLEQNYPNPFNPTTRIDYSIKSAGIVTLKVYDMLGMEVASLIGERQEPGNYSVEFNAGNLPSGIYVYKLIAGDFVDVKKLSLLK